MGRPLPCVCVRRIERVAHAGTLSLSASPLAAAALQEAPPFVQGLLALVQANRSCDLASSWRGALSGWQGLKLEDGRLVEL